MWAVVMPALNEAATIGPVIKGLKAVGAMVIVVDDGSTDDTTLQAEAAGAAVLRNEAPTGYDAALSKGINHAFSVDMNFVLTCDADGQHRPEDVHKMVRKMMIRRLDLCAGVRDEHNRFVETVAGWISARIFESSDPFCGLKGYSKKLYKKVGPFPKELNVGSLPFVWVKQWGLSQACVPIVVEPRLDQARFGRTLNANLKLAKAFLKTVEAFVWWKMTGN